MEAVPEPPARPSQGYQESIRESRLLLVEGREDVRVFEELSTHWGFSGIQIIDMEGITNLRRQLSVLVRDPGFQNLRTLGIARDADNDSQNAFASVRDALAAVPSLRVGLPTRPGVRGTGRPATVVLIVPDNASPGNLESMLNRTKSGDAIEGCIDGYFACLSELAGVKPAGARLDKARAYARIAASSNPARSVGHSVRATGVWDLDHESLNPVKEFLAQL